nr:uncharacterized protein LOC113799910 [Penaeus vannamei]
MADLLNSLSGLSAIQNEKCQYRNVTLRSGRDSSVKEGGVVVSRPPLVRSRTLPAIVVPGVTVLQTALDASDRRDVGGTSPHQVVPADSPIRPLLTVTSFDSTSGDRTSPGRVSCGDVELLGLSPTSGSPGGLKVPGAVAATSGGLGRIARLLVKDPSRSGEDSFRRRTHSLESKNGVPPLRRAASIDSLVDTSSNNNNNNKSASSTSFSTAKSNGHLRSYLPVSPALIKRPSFKFDKSAAASSGKSDVLCLIFFFFLIFF